MLSQEMRTKKKKVGGAENPSRTPIEVKGSKTASATTVREVPMSHELGRLLKGFLRVRIMKITSTCVAMDSMNQPVWNSASPAWKTASN